MDSARAPLVPVHGNIRLKAADAASTFGVYPNSKPTRPINADTIQGTSTKRSYSALDLDDDDGLPLITESCDAIRRKITAFINSGEMKVTDFQRTLGVNSNSYNRSMKLKGPSAGNSNQVYPAAFRFFDERKKAGIKPQKKKVKKDEEGRKLDVSGVELPGEQEGGIEVYETCDEIRKKINAFHSEPDVTQAAFLREVAKMHPEGKAIQRKQLKDFLSKKGALAGNTSKVFYCSYVFFEKMRIKQGKPKSAMREGTEDAWCTEGGVEIKRLRDGGYVCSADFVLVQDKYGKVRTERR